MCIRDRRGVASSCCPTRRPCTVVCPAVALVRSTAVWQRLLAGVAAGAGVAAAAVAAVNAAMSIIAIVRPRSASSAVIVLGLTPVRVVDLDLGCGRAGVPDVAVGVSGPWWWGGGGCQDPEFRGLVGERLRGVSFCTVRRGR